MSHESNLLLNLTSIIDRDVLHDITKYLKFHEPKINQQFDRLDKIYSDYLKSYKSIEKLNSKHVDQLRIKEFSQSNANVEEEQEREQDQSIVDESYADEDSVNEDNEFDLDFPLQLGTVVVSGPEELQNIMTQLINKVPTIPRKIPLPGYKNEIFNSESLCKVLLKIPIRGLKPSRLNLEKFGQSLIDLKLITGNNFFNKKFKSEGMWFEWSDLASYFAASSVKDTSSIGTATSTSKSTTLTSPRASKFISDMTETTTRFSALFNNVKSSILKTNYDELLEDIEKKYNEEMLNLQEYKYLLENGLFEISQYLETFEKIKIEMIYKSLSRLSEILVQFQKKQFEEMQAFSNEFVHKINRSTNYAHDFDKMLDSFSTGVYFSSLISPDTSSLNLKYQFDLYKDIPLQLQNNFNCDNESLLSIASIPYILYQAVKIIEERNDNVEDIRKLWLSPIEYQSQWRLKQDIIEIISNFTPDLKNDLANKNLIEQEFCNQVLNHLKSQKTTSVVIFLKNWLLEISDSIMPFVIFDSLMNLYDKDQVSNADLIKLLSSIPRSNLSSLVYFIEYIATIFDVGSIPNYEISDELPEESLMENIECSQIEKISEELNSMDQIGAIPLMHLILRPSTSKHSTGFKPPVDKYKRILSDLLKLEVRIELFKNLIDNELNYKNKKEAEKLQVKRLPMPVTVVEPTNPPNGNGSTNTVSVATPTIKPPPPRPESGEFTLRPFRTKPTPNPSPQTSPKRASALLSLNDKVDTSSMELLPPNSHHHHHSQQQSHGRVRSLSNVVPKIDIEFEK
ncbi:hypothetical protein SBY92_003574 [Candida maltosa Xu316]